MCDRTGYKNPFRQNHQISGPRINCKTAFLEPFSLERPGNGTPAPPKRTAASGAPTRRVCGTRWTLQSSPSPGIPCTHLVGEFVVKGETDRGEHLAKQQDSFCLNRRFDLLMYSNRHPSWLNQMEPSVPKLSCITNWLSTMDPNCGARPQEPLVSPRRAGSRKGAHSTHTLFCLRGSGTPDQLRRILGSRQCRRRWPPQARHRRSPRCR